MSQKTKIAAVQTNPRLMNPGENLESVISAIKKAAEKQANLIVFPECCLSGYIFHSREEALPFAGAIPGPVTDTLSSLCKELKAYVIFGLLEKEKDKLFNAAAFIGPSGIIGKYRKNHLPFLGVDRFVDRGDKSFEVYQTPIGNIGIEICYDIIFPESSRVMALRGADILALPTNFPQGRGETITNHVVSTRAIENRVHVVAANRIGTERGRSFTGLSKIVNASWDTLALASPDKEEIIYGEVDLETARQKRDIIIPGQHEVDFIKDRRPELYGVITEPVDDGNTEFVPLMTTGANSGTLRWNQLVQRTLFGTMLAQGLPHKPSEDVYTLAAKLTRTSETDPLRAIVIADVDMMGEQFFELRRRGIESLSFDNVTFLLNAVDELAGDESFIALRKRRPKHRTLEAVEARTRVYEQQRVGETEAAQATAERRLAEAQARLDAAVERLRRRPDLDEQTRQIMIENLRAAEERRLQVARANVEDERDRQIENARATMEASVRRIQNTIKLLAVGLPPIPAFLILVFVSLRKLKRERVRISTDRLIDRRTT